MLKIRDDQSLLRESSSDQSPEDGTTGTQMIPQNDTGSSTLTPIMSFQEVKVSKQVECILDQ